MAEMQTNPMDALNAATELNQPEDDSLNPYYAELAEEVEQSDFKREFTNALDARQKGRSEDDIAKTLKEDNDHATQVAKERLAETKRSSDLKKPSLRKSASAPSSSAPTQRPDPKRPLVFASPYYDAPEMTAYQLSCMEEDEANTRSVQFAVDPQYPWNRGRIADTMISTCYGAGEPKGRIDAPCYKDGKEVKLNRLSDRDMGLHRLLPRQDNGFGTPTPNVVFMPLWSVERTADWLRHLIVQQDGAYVEKYDERESGRNPLKKRKVWLLNSPKDVCLKAIDQWEKSARCIENEPPYNKMEHYCPTRSTDSPVESSSVSALEKTRSRKNHEAAEKMNQGIAELAAHDEAEGMRDSLGKAKGEAVYQDLLKREEEAEAEAQAAKKPVTWKERVTEHSNRKTYRGTSTEERYGLEDEMRENPQWFTNS